MEDVFSLQNKRLLRVDEAARLLNVSRWTIYRWVEAGQLGGTRIGAGTLRIFSDTVAALISRHCIGVPIAAGAAQRGQAPVVPISGAKRRKPTLADTTGSRRRATTAS
ncbi:MAG: helix-turn-helix domain-containing protein [Nitrospira sp.]|nr:helix-turn-helix domain-containing protein [Nitrospira sp.]